MKLFARINLVALLFTAVVLSACSQKLSNNGCPPQMCTMEFATVGVKFTDKAGNPVNVKDVTVINQRTNKPIVTQTAGSPDNTAGNYAVVTDGNKKEISTNGDDLNITAISAADGKTVSAVIKVIGGCNCHVKKIAGPEAIVFE